MKTYSLNGHDAVLYSNDVELTATTLEGLEKECLSLFSALEISWLWVIFEFEEILYTMYPSGPSVYKAKILSEIPEVHSVVVTKIAEADFG